MSNHQDKVNQIQQMPGVTGVSVSNSSGQIETSTMSSPQSDLGTVASAMYSNIGVQIKRMQRGTVNRIVLETEAGITLLAGIAGGGLLIVFAEVVEGFNLTKLISTTSQF